MGSVLKRVLAVAALVLAFSSAKTTLAEEEQEPDEHAHAQEARTIVVPLAQWNGVREELRSSVARLDAKIREMKELRRQLNQLRAENKRLTERLAAKQP